MTINETENNKVNITDWAGAGRPQESAEACCIIAGDGEDGNRGAIEIVPALTPVLLERVYRLRYDVYCVANEFENPDHQLAGYEQDKYDDYSVHSLLMDTETGADLGSVRLILPNEDVSLP